MSLQSESILHSKNCIFCVNWDGKRAAPKLNKNYYTFNSTEPGYCEFKRKEVLAHHYCSNYELDRYKYREQ